jgi:hypothetical protein
MTQATPIARSSLRRGAAVYVSLSSMDDTSLTAEAAVEVLSSRGRHGRMRWKDLLDRTFGFGLPNVRFGPVAQLVRAHP